MTRSFRVHYNGTVLVPEAPIDLPLNESLVVVVENPSTDASPAHGTVAYLSGRRKGRGITDQDAEQMRSAIE